MENGFIKRLLLLILLLVGVFRSGYTQITKEQELIFSDDTLFVFNKNGQLGLGKDSNTVVYKYDSIVLNHHRDMIMAMKEGKSYKFYTASPVNRFYF